MVRSEPCAGPGAEELLLLVAGTARAPTSRSSPFFVPGTEGAADRISGSGVSGTDRDLDRAAYLDPDNQLMLSRKGMEWSPYAPGPARRTETEASPLPRMHLATFIAPGEDTPRSGDVQGEQVVSFTDGITTEQVVVAVPGDRPTATGPSFALTDVQLVAPYRPRAVFMVGANYAQHVADAAKVGNTAGNMNEGEIPCLLKGPGSPIGPFEQIVRPAAIKSLDYEGELMVIVGHDGKPGGYAVANDVSARDVGDKWQLTRHKGGDTFCPWGPWVTTVDEIEDPYSLQIRTWVDGDLRQNGNTDEMIVQIPEILAYISKTITPQPGDGLLTGTCAGTIAEMADPVWLQPGNRVRVEIERLGAIENEIAAA